MSPNDLAPAVPDGSLGEPAWVSDAAGFATVEDAIDEIARGRMVVLVDDADRENEGDLVMAADLVTAGDVNFMLSHARGCVCVALTPDRCDALELQLQVPEALEAPRLTPFTMTIDARWGITTGVSSEDRARTIRVAADPDAGHEQLVVGGHISALRARAGGALERNGHTEASIELARLAGCEPAGVICEILNGDGTMARVPQLRTYCERHGLKMLMIADLVAYLAARAPTSPTVAAPRDGGAERVVVSRLPTRYGDFRVVGYRSAPDTTQVALVKGDPSADDAALVRVHSQCLTGDAFGSLLCDCGEQLERALREIEAHGSGVLVYLAQEGRGIGLLNKLRAYELQSRGYDTVEANITLGFPADLREYGVAARILRDLGIERVRLLTNNPDKVRGLREAGITVVERVAIEPAANPHNIHYLRTKQEQMGHAISPQLERVAAPGLGRVAGSELGRVAGSGLRVAGSAA